MQRAPQIGINFKEEIGRQGTIGFLTSGLRLGARKLTTRDGLLGLPMTGKITDSHIEIQGPKPNTWRSTE